MTANEKVGARAMRALVICTHLRPSRDKRKSSYLMQPLAGLQVASIIQAEGYAVELYHEDWHGPFDTAHCQGFDLVFLSGLQVDFDRMRQLSFHFRRAGARVVAGGSVATCFPEFASQFFDAVCAGGVDAARQVARDFAAGALKSIYRSSGMAISRYDVDYGLFARAGISPRVHLMEATRGCTFKCGFCVVPGEIGGHATFGVANVAKAFDDSYRHAPWWSFRKRYPLILFHDNNFSDDRAYMREVVAMMKADKRIKGWAALVTQNILHDRALIAELAQGKCIGLFIGLESLDDAMLKRYNKTQNRSRRFNVIDDIGYAESLGIAITYGYLFDPRYQDAVEMARQIRQIGEHPTMPMPVYLSVIAPLAGTPAFWDDLAHRRLAANLRFRDLDGEAIAYSTLADAPDNIVNFIEAMFRKPWTVIPRGKMIAKALRRIWRAPWVDPVRWSIMVEASLHSFLWSSATPIAKRTYRAGSDPLDPQYGEYPSDLSDEDRARYFDPVFITDAEGEPMDWLKPYIPKAEAKGSARVTVLEGAAAAPEA